MRALAGLRSTAHLLLVAATKAGDISNLLAGDEFRDLVEKRRPLEALGFFREQPLDAVVLAALPTKRRFCVSGFELAEPAMRAISANLLRRPGCVTGHDGPRLAAARRRLGSLRSAHNLRMLHRRNFVRGNFGSANESRAFLDHEPCSFKVAI